MIDKNVFEKIIKELSGPEMFFLGVLVDEGGGAYENNLFEEFDRADQLVELMTPGKTYNRLELIGFLRDIHVRINRRFGNEIINWNTKRGGRTYYQINDRYLQMVREALNR